MVAFKDVKTKETTSSLVRKVVKVAYGSLHLRKLFITELKLAFKRDFTTLVTIRAVANRNCHKESFDCIYRCLEQCVFLDWKP